MSGDVRRRYVVEYAGVDAGASAEGKKFVGTTSESEAAIRAFNREMEKYVKQAVLAGNTTREANAIYETSVGKYRLMGEATDGVTNSTKNLLIAKAREADLAKQTAAAEDAAAKMMDKWTRATALGTDATNTATAAFERQNGTLKLLSDARYSDVVAAAQHRDAVILAAEQEAAAVAASAEKQKASREIASAIPKGLGFLAKGAEAGALVADATVYEGTKTFMSLEPYENSLKLKMGIQGAREELEKLRQVALGPGLDFKTVLKGDALFQQLGYHGDQARKIMQEFGNAIALKGGGPDELSAVIDKLAVIDTRSKLTARSLTALVDATPQIKDALKGAFGTDNLEDIAKLKLTGGQFIDAIVNQYSRLQRAQDTLGNQWKNLKDKAEEFFEALSDKTKGSVSKLITDVSGAVDKLITSVNHLSQPQADMIVKMAVGLTLLVPALKGLEVASHAFEFFASKAELLGTIATQAGGLGAALTELATGPVGIAIAAVSALVLAWKTDFGGIREVAKEVADDVVKFWKDAQPQFQNIMDDFKADMQSLKPVLEWLSGQFRFYFEVIRAAIGASLDQVSFTLGLATAAFHSFSEGISFVVDMITGKWRGGLSNMSLEGQAFVAHLRAIGADIINAIVSFVNQGIDKLNALFGALNKVKGGLADTILGPFGKAVPGLPMIGHVLPGFQAYTDFAHTLVDASERAIQQQRDAARAAAERAARDAAYDDGELRGRYGHPSGYGDPLPKTPHYPGGGGGGGHHRAAAAHPLSDNIFGITPEMLDLLKKYRQEQAQWTADMNAKNNKALSDHASLLKTVNDNYADLLAKQLEKTDNDPKEAAALDLVHKHYKDLAPDIQNVINKIVDLGKTQEAITKIQADNDFLNMYDPRNGGSKPVGNFWAKNLGDTITKTVAASGAEEGKKQLADLTDQYQQLTLSATAYLKVQMQLQHIPLDAQAKILKERALIDTTQAALDLRAKLSDAFSQGVSDGVSEGLSHGLKAGIAAFAKDIDGAIFAAIEARITQYAVAAIQPGLNKLIPLPGKGGGTSGFNGQTGSASMNWTQFLGNFIPWSSLFNFGSGGSGGSNSGSTAAGGDLPPVARGNARGGIAPAHVPSWFDEEGSEIRDYGSRKLIIPSRDVKIIPHDKSMATLSPSRSVTEEHVHLHFHDAAAVDPVLQNRQAAIVRGKQLADTEQRRNRG